MTKFLESVNDNDDDGDNDFVWRWSSSSANETLAFSDWASAFPRGMPATTGGALLTGDDFKWADIPTFLSIGLICERELTRKRTFKPSESKLQVLINFLARHLRA